MIEGLFLLAAGLCLPVMLFCAAVFATHAAFIRLRAAIFRRRNEARDLAAAKKHNLAARRRIAEARFVRDLSLTARSDLP
jgi:hypothetical protein